MIKSKDLIRRLSPKLFLIIKFSSKILFKDKVYKNVLKTKFKKKALLSYISEPFLSKDSYKHTSYFEARTWAEILSKLEYNVDVVNYDFELDIKYDEYSLICGFGNVFDNLKSINKVKLIHYGTGFNNIVSNENSINRLYQVAMAKGGCLLSSSIRYNKFSWRFQTQISDAIISLGNQTASSTYKKFYNGKVFELNAPYHKITDPINIIENKNKNYQKKFMWFGSSGAIHKGLDLLLLFFCENPQFEFHICGLSDLEINFKNVFKNELNSSNIYNHGFVNMNSIKYVQLLKECGYIIFPSCSEGGSPSLVNIIGNGGLFPIHTKETSVSFPNEIIINNFDVKSIDKAINHSQLIDEKS